MQAEYARVPLADVNALKVPEGISDAKVGTCTAAWDVAERAWNT